MSVSRVLILAAIGVSLAANLAAQEIHATITGSVADSSGAAVSGATVTAINLDTGFSTSVTSAADGAYHLTRLPRGNYRIVADAPGFRQHKREPVTLASGDKANLPIALAIGATTDSVTVTAELSGIESNQSVMDQLIDNKKVSELPLNGRNFIMLLQFNAGVLFTQQQFGAGGWTMPNQWASSGAGKAFTMHGGQPGTSAFMLDGGGQNTDPHYAPPPEAVEDMKTGAPTSDASFGLSGGGVVNVTMRSGTNQLHGSLGHFLRNNILGANYIQANRSAEARPDLANNRSQFNNFTVVVSGPIIRNKLFFSGNFDGFRMRFAQPVTISVPTMAQRAGDFSSTRNAAGQLIQIFDPLTTRQQGTQYVRDAFPGNLVPGNRIVPVSTNILKSMPAPNLSLDPVTNLLNYSNPANIGQQRYDSEYVKVDQLWNERHRTFVSENVHKGYNYRSNNGLARGNPLMTGNDRQVRQNFAATIDHVWTVNAATVLNLRLSWNRYTAGATQEYVDSIDGSTLGFKGRIGSNPVTRIPVFNLNGYGTFGPNLRNFNPSEPYTAVADLSRTMGRHLVRAGARIALWRFGKIAPGNENGTFTFNNGFTSRDPLRGDTTSGNSMAAFLMGFPASGSTDTNTASSWQNMAYGLYAQDDFKLNRKLTLNFGLRWDAQTPSTERFNRIVRGFDPNVTYSLGAAQARGGYLFADPDHRQAWSTNWRDFQPRFGAAYQTSAKMVWRGGYGISYLPVNVLDGPALNQSGFSRSTPFVATLGGGVNSYIPGLPGTGTLENPFPNGILAPLGSSLGPKTMLGQAVNYVNPDLMIPRVHQFHFGVGYQLPWKTLLDVSYVGNRTRKLETSRTTSFIPLDERLKGVADPTYLSKSVPNPFAGAPELAGTSLSGAQVALSQTLTPYPQFTAVTLRGNNNGSSSYNSLEIRANKRMTGGLVLTTTYTFAKAIEALTYREPQTPDLLRQLSPWDRTHHLGIQALYELPVGHGRASGKSWPRALDLLAGGWQWNMSVEYMNGTPTPMPNANPVRNPALGSEQTFQRWFNTCTLLTNGTRATCASPDEPITWVQYKPNELSTSSTVMPNIRNHWRSQANTSVMKHFRIRERMTFTLRGEAFNVTNTRIYPGPDMGITSPLFGRVTLDQNNFPREVQLALQLRF